MSRDQRSDPPGAVSDQNQEQAESELREDRTHPEPRTNPEERPRREPSAGEDDTKGAAREGSQSTGDPRSAG